VKKLSFAAGAAVLATIAAPLGAQQLTAKSYDFVHAVEQRNGDKATELLNDNPPGIVNSRNGDGDTGLIIAISRQDPDWTGFLLKKGADINLGGKGGDTPLIAAARVGFEDAAEWLISLGAKVDGANKMGETPLIVAVQQREPRLVSILLNAGANPDKPDSAAGYSARDYAARDNRGRQILQLIEAKKPKPPSAH
jgi:ankyrin repeat protein